jgi:uncharacterized protein (TIGR02466 family)
MKEDNLKTFAIFPQATIALIKLNINTNKILNYLNKIKFEGEEQLKNKENTCFMTPDLEILNKIPFLKKNIFNCVENYLKNIMKFKMNFQFTTSWAIKTMPNGCSQKHAHPNSFLSGVYYPKGNKGFNIKFYRKNNFWNIKTIENNDFNAEWYTFNIIEDNILLLFPSDLEHSIEKNLSEETRYSIAFNSLPLGEIGSGDSKINFK